MHKIVCYLYFLLFSAMASAYEVTVQMNPDRSFFKLYEARKDGGTIEPVKQGNIDKFSFSVQGYSSAQIAAYSIVVIMRSFKLASLAPFAA